MNLIKSILLRLVRTAVCAAIEEALKIAVKEVNEEIDVHVEDETQRASAKESVILVDQKLRGLLNEKLSLGV